MTVSILVPRQVSIYEVQNSRTPASRLADQRGVRGALRAGNCSLDRNYHKLFARVRRSKARNVCRTRLLLLPPVLGPIWIVPYLSLYERASINTFYLRQYNQN